MLEGPDDLFTLPLEEFTAARNELAASVRNSGDPETAEQIRKLKRPTVAAWAINQLARDNYDLLRRLFDLRTELERAGTPQDLRRLTQERRELLSRLVERARALLDQAGHPSSSATIDKVSQTLMAGDTEEDRARILEGTLSKELAPSGAGAFGAFGELTAFDAEPSEGVTDEPAPDPKVERLQRELEEARSEVDRLQEIAFEAEASAAAAREEVANAERRAERISKRLEKARG